MVWELYRKRQAGFVADCYHDIQIIVKSQPSSSWCLITSSKSHTRDTCKSVNISVPNGRLSDTWTLFHCFPGARDCLVYRLSGANLRFLSGLPRRKGRKYRVFYVRWCTLVGHGEFIWPWLCFPRCWGSLEQISCGLWLSRVVLGIRKQSDWEST